MGSIREGKYADFVLLDRDILTGHAWEPIENTSIY